MATTLALPATRIRFSRQIAAELAALDAAEIGRTAADATALVRTGRASPAFARRNAIAPYTGANRMYFDPHSIMRDAIARSHNATPCRRLLSRQDAYQPTDDDREVIEHLRAVAAPEPTPVEPDRAAVDRGDWSDWLDDDSLISRRDRLIGLAALAALFAVNVGLGVLLARLF